MLQQRFDNVLQSLFTGSLPRNIGIALSGGIDSMCLTSLLHRHIVLNSLPTRIYPITINHNLRNSSSLELPIIRKNIQRMGIDTENYLTKSIDISFKNTTSFEEDAREARYKALRQLCDLHDIEHIFLAHHLDDQLETFIMRLFGNSGIFGLCAMDWKSKLSVGVSPLKLNLVRPMLEINKNEIYQYCIENKIEWVQDFTNFEEINKRNLIRKYLNANPILKSEVRSEFAKVRKLTTYIDSQVNRLHSYLVESSMIIANESRVSILLTKQQIEENSEHVIARLLFKLLFPFSPSKNYHSSFNKILHSIPKLNRDTSFSLLQLQWNVKHADGLIQLEVKRQNLKDPVTTNVEIAKGESTDWFLFDNRFWFKIRNATNIDQNLTVRTLMKNDKALFEKIPKGFKYSSYANLPVLIDNNTAKIISLPMASPTDDIQWKLKENIYSFE
jgi:tRNA(Ile)-lysidine synthetase-like protein